MEFHIENKNLWYNRSMELLNKHRLTRLQKLILAALVASMVFLLGNIPFVANTFFVYGITRGLSWLIGRLTNFISISLYEVTAILLILGGVAVLLFLVIWLCQRRFSKVLKLLYCLGMGGLFVLTAFGLTYAPLYERPEVSKALSLPEVTVTSDAVYQAAEYFVEELNNASVQMVRDDRGNVVCPYTFHELAKILNDEFDKIEGNYFAWYDVWPKEVAFSVPMSYLGITGIYFPFYAEANVNVNILDSELPVTMAHEMAHAKGVAVESEANVTAYVLCIRSDDEFLRYSGLMDVVAQLLNELPEEQYDTLYARLDEEVRAEYRNIRLHYEKYEGVIDKISEFFNDLFLKSNGIVSGTQNYGETTRSLVALWAQCTENV